MRKQRTALGATVYRPHQEDNEWPRVALERCVNGLPETLWQSKKYEENGEFSLIASDSLFSLEIEDEIKAGG